MSLQYRTTGRSVRALVTLTVVWAMLLGLWVGLQATWVLIALGFICTLPALWEFITAKPSGLTLTSENIRWFSGRHEGTVALGQVDHVRLDTRLDMSIRASLVLHSGRRVRLPQDAVPPVETLVKSLADVGQRTERHHFSLLG